MTDTIDIRGIDRAELLAELFHAAARLPRSPRMTIAEAQQLLSDYAGQGGRRATLIDYHEGRCLKCDVMQDDFWPVAYDRDNGQGTAARVIEKLRADTAAE